MEGMCVWVGGLGVGSVHVSPSASMQKKKKRFNESGAGFILHGRFGSGTGDSNQLGRSQRISQDEECFRRYSLTLRKADGAVWS